MLVFITETPLKKLLNLIVEPFANRKWETICEEVEGCDVYCFNHHMELHYGSSWDDM